MSSGAVFALVGELIMAWARIERVIFEVAADGPPTVGYREDVPASKEPHNKFHKRLETWKTIYRDSLSEYPNDLNYLESVYSTIKSIYIMRNDLAHNISGDEFRDGQNHLCIRRPMSCDGIENEMEAVYQRFFKWQKKVGNPEKVAIERQKTNNACIDLKFGFYISETEIRKAIKTLYDIEAGLRDLYWKIAFNGLSKRAN